MVKKSPSKRITSGIHLYDKIMKDSSSISLGITQEIKNIAESLAKIRTSEKLEASNFINEQFSKLRSSKKKRKTYEINSSSIE